MCCPPVLHWFYFNYIQVDENKYNLEFSSSVALDTFLILNSFMCLVAVLVVDIIKIEHFQHDRKFCWTMLFVSVN